jgi:hypothetical protein
MILFACAILVVPRLVLRGIENESERSVVFQSVTLERFLTGSTFVGIQILPHRGYSLRDNSSTVSVGGRVDIQFGRQEVGRGRAGPLSMRIGKTTFVGQYTIDSSIVYLWLDRANGKPTGLSTALAMPLPRRMGDGIVVRGTGRETWRFGYLVLQRSTILNEGTAIDIGDSAK